METELQTTQCKHPKGDVGIMMSKFNTPKNIIKILSNVHKIEGAHLQCVNNHQPAFEYKGMKTVGVTDYTNQTPSKHFGKKKCQSSASQKNKKIFIKCVENIRCTSSMCEQSLYKV